MQYNISKLITSKWEVVASVEAKSRRQAMEIIRGREPQREFNFGETALKEGCYKVSKDD